MKSEALSILILLLTTSTAHDFYRKWFIPRSDQTSCGYDACHPTRYDVDTNVHVVAHSHDDTGWLKTVDQYYYGSKTSIKRAGVQYIIESVVLELALDPNKRFIQVEAAFFWRWWKEQDQFMQDMVRQLVSEGRLEIAGGGWSMNDEAITHYTGIIHNMALGMNQMKEYFGDCGVPRVAWQVDPFGHSKEQANLFARMGLDGIFFSRIDYRDKEQRKAEKTMQMVWEGSDHLGESSSIFTGVLAELYASPKGFCFDIRGDADPINDDVNIKGYNVDEYVEKFLDLVRNNRTNFQNGKHIMFTFGGDFAFQNAAQHYKNLDKLIKHVNERTNETGIYMLYSTPSCFLKALNELNETWPSKNDDFFPYAMEPHDYWSGYFTSRPAFKYHERVASGLLQAAQQLTVTLKAFERTGELRGLETALGIAQHHDAITGTSKQPVDHDNNLRLSEGENTARTLMIQEMLSYVGLPVDDPMASYSCSNLNVSACSITEQENRLALFVYNPLPRKSSFYVRFPITDGKIVTVFDGESELFIEIVPIRDEIQNIPGRESDATVEAIFLAENIPALGMKSFFIEQTVGQPAILSPKPITLQEYFNKELPSELEIEMGYYFANQDTDIRASGAYIFRPNGTEPKIAKLVSVEELVTSMLEEYHLTFEENWLSCILRRYIGEEHWEIDWLVGPIPVDDHQGKETIMRYKSKADGGNDPGTDFWTDANGRQFILRRRDHRFSFDIQDGPEMEPVASNYYPVTTAIFLDNVGLDKKQFSIAVDRSESASSLNANQIEIMVHRRLLADDDHGVGEALNESAFGQGLVVRGSHFYNMESRANATRWRRLRMQEQFMKPGLFFVPSLNGPFVGQSFSGLKADLPENVNILTLAPSFDHESSGKILVRLEHIFEPNEHPTLSLPAKVDLLNILSSFQFTYYEETTLGATQLLNEVERLHWNTQKWNSNHNSAHSMGVGGRQTEEITLEPMEIRTFLLTPAGKANGTQGNLKSNCTLMLFLILMCLRIKALLYGMQ